MRAISSHGYWRPGGIAPVDENGFTRILDRRKDMVNRDGFEVFSMGGEDKLSYHEALIQCAVAGKPASVPGERVHAYVFAEDGMAVDIDAHCSFCTELQSGYMRAESCTADKHPCPAIIMTETKKQP